MIDLRSYQTKAIDDLTQAAIEGKRRLLLVAPTGSGKGVIATAIMQHANSNGNKILFLTHRREILYQCSKHLESYGVDHGLILPEEPFRPEKNIQLASIPSYNARARRGHIISTELDLLITDECFPGWVKVGDKPIKEIQVGDFIPSYFNGRIVPGKVTRKFIRSPEALITVKTSLGNITCTPSHPLLTDEGWKPASKCGKNMVLCTNYEMSYLPGRNNQAVAVEGSFNEKNRENLLFKKMLSGICLQNFLLDDGKDKSNVCVRTNEKKQSHEKARGTEQSKYHFAGYGMETKNPWREWEADTSTATALSIKTGMGSGVCSTNRNERKRRVCVELQNRYSKFNFEDRDRNRRLFSRRTEKARTRPQKRGFFNWVRVEDIKIHESGSDGEYGGLCPDGLVYNLEVEPNHTYIAGGFVVHNCHHLPSSETWGKIHARFPNAIILGMTATPINSAGLGLGGWFDAMVKCPSIKELTGMGHLVPVKYYAPTLPDLQNVRIKAGDYDQGQLEEKMDKPKLIGEVCENWSRICPDRKTIVFASGVRHSLHIAESFNALGVKAEHVDGSTDKEKRDEIISRFRNGDLQVLSNCSVFTEGVDIPVASCLVFARPTKSLLLYIQVAGRVLRPYPGKSDAYIIDHAGAIYSHGPVDQDFDWKLDGPLEPKEKAEKKKKERTKRTITCFQCKRVYEGRLNCPDCGWAPKLKSDIVPTYEAYLQEMTDPETKVHDRREWYLQLLGYARKRGYKDGWAAFKYREKFEMWPGGLWKNAGPKDPQMEILSWIRYLGIKWSRGKNKKPQQQVLPPSPPKVVSHGYERINKLAQDGYVRE